MSARMPYSAPLAQPANSYSYNKHTPPSIASSVYSQAPCYETPPFRNVHCGQVVYGTTYSSAPGYYHMPMHPHPQAYCQVQMNSNGFNYAQPQRHPAFNKHAPNMKSGPSVNNSHPTAETRLDGNSAVRGTIRNMVGNLEHVITNLHGIVGDLRVLVQQIDVVTNKIGGQYGVNWDKPDVNHACNPQDKVPKTKDMDSFGLCRWQTLREKCNSTEFSPDIDWSYLGLSECNNDDNNNNDVSPTTNNKSPRATSVNMQCKKNCGRHHSLRTSRVKGDFDHTSDGFRKGKTTTVCSKVSTNIFDLENEINFDCLEMNGHSSDLESDSKTSRVPKKLRPTPHVPPHVQCKEVTENANKGDYCGLYESAMELKLEALSNSDETFSDSEQDIEDITSITDDLPNSVTSLDCKAEYDRQVNPWKSFGLVHIDSTQGSDEILSECASDILNDNYLETSYINPGFEDVQSLVQHTIC